MRSLFCVHIYEPHLQKLQIWNTLTYNSSFIQRKISEISYLGYKCGNTLENERDICTYKTYGMQKILLIIHTNLYYIILCKTKSRCYCQDKSVTILAREKKCNKSRPKWSHSFYLPYDSFVCFFFFVQKKKKGVILPNIFLLKKKEVVTELHDIYFECVRVNYGGGELSL